jgi:hypothetical protein
VTGHSWEMFEKLGVVWNSSARCEKKKKKKKKFFVVVIVTSMWTRSESIVVK